jgi:ketosteroid isomerase-like protein
VLDAGSGSGASTLAYLAYLDNIIDHPLQIDLTLVDRSNAQLNLAKKIIGLSAIHLRRLKLQCRCRRLDIRSLNLDIYPELILQGHVLTENVPDVRSILSRMTAAVSEDGQIYVIERSHDLVWRSIHSCISSLAFPATFNTVESADRITKVASEHLSNISLSTRFLVLRSPERKLLVKLIQKYFAAWQEQSPELLDQVFTPDAQYHEKPGEPPLQGIYAIKEYWKCKVVSQRNININVKHYSYTADDVTAEWFVTFDREADRQYDIRGMLILKLDPRRGLISSLREYFTTSKT